MVLLTVAGGYYAVLVYRPHYSLPLGPLEACLVLAAGYMILLYVPFWLSFVARQVHGWRHADGERRQQLKLFGLLKDAMDPDAVRVDLLDVVQRALEPTHVAVWAGPRQPGNLDQLRPPIPPAPAAPQ